MSLKSLVTPILAVTILSATLAANPVDGPRTWREAVRFYQNGMYAQAKVLFESLGDDPVSEGYAVLCALKMQGEDGPELLTDYLQRHPASGLADPLYFEYGRILFDKGEYDRAAEAFSNVSSAGLTDAETAEYLFKYGYAAYALGHNEEASQYFMVLESLPQSDYTAPGRYYAGMILYDASRFPEAEAKFWQAVEDPRLTDLANFYIVDCEFNQKNYDFVIREGERIYESVPTERRERLARIISESYLVKGNKEKAREYYDEQSHKGMNRKDYFYAATVLYSVDDFAGAIENFLRMGDRSDSLGQVANYHLANSYLRTHDQVSAMNSFRAASEVDFDPEITEDAAFNYAKLAFDLNKDTSGFANYIRRWSTKARGDQIYGYMALAALVDRDYAAAVEAYDNIEELTPDMRSNYTKANFLRGAQLMESGSYRDAVPYFRATAYYVPRTERLNQLARYWLAEANYRAGNWEDAVKTFTELHHASALDGTPEGDLLPYNVAYSYFKQGEYATAAQWFDSYLTGDDSRFREDAMTRRADCDFGRKDYRSAIRSYQNVLTEYFSADDIYPWYQQAVAYGLSGDKRRKVSTLLHVEDSSPDAPFYNEATYELGRAQMDVNSNNDAVRTFKRLLENTSDNTYVARALIGLGMVYRNQSKYNDALDSYKQVVSLMPRSEYAEEAMLAIESIYQTLRQPQKFLEYVEQNSLAAGRADSDREQMYFSTAEQLYLAGNWQEAVPTLVKYLEGYPDAKDRAQAEFYLAESYNALGEKEKAVEAYGRAAAAESEYSFAEMSRLRFADLSYGLERYQDAYRGYRNLLETARMDANRQTARVGMMRSAYRSKDYEEAIRTADAVIADRDLDAAVRDEARFTKAKSSLATSRRDEAMSLFRQLGANPSTAIGAESEYQVIQGLFDSGRFADVEKEVYDFSQKAGDQSYWLARAYIVLGDSFAERGMYAQARATYESIRDGYEPERGSDDVADNVKMRLDRLPKQE
ncbi:MAG: tetratricopeptide repeat protein [Bacteroidales bacterium]|nr:tetratricopeptide repeat protein [Bacteroidales bacterium]